MYRHRHASTSHRRSLNSLEASRGHFNRHFLQGTDIIANNTPEIFSFHVTYGWRWCKSRDRKRGGGEIRQRSPSVFKCFFFKNLSGESEARSHQPRLSLHAILYRVFAQPHYVQANLSPSQWTLTHRRNSVNKSIMI